MINRISLFVLNISLCLFESKILNQKPDVLYVDDAYALMNASYNAVSDEFNTDGTESYCWEISPLFWHTCLHLLRETQKELVYFVFHY